MDEIKTPKRRRTKKTFPKEGGALQGHKDETDINRIVAMHSENGTMPRLALSEAHYGDFSDAPTLHEAYNRVLRVDDAYAALPSTVRAASDNSPLKFADMLGDEDGFNLLERAGLTIRAEEEPPTSSAKQPPEESKTAPPEPKATKESEAPKV